MELKHYGTPRHSGRYPWGSGENPYQRTGGFLGAYKNLKSQGLTDAQIAKAMGMTTLEMRAKRSISNDQQRAADYAQALEMKDRGYSYTEIGRRMGKNESSIRSLLNPAIQQRAETTMATADALKKSLEKTKYLDIGIGVERYMGVAKTKLDTAVQVLKEEGYTVHYLKVEQLNNPGNYTSIKVLAPPGTTYTDIYKNRDKIGGVTEFSEDKGISYRGLKPVQNVDSKRIKINYDEDGGTDKDGVIELRRGVDDLDLGNSRYAQVRIGVDGTHYLKGMAIYSDNMPDGVDIIYNTNKKRGTPSEKVFKEMVVDERTGKIDQSNPFGATIKIDGQRGSLNVVNEEGDWDTWSRNLSSQVLSKQPVSLAKKQLNLAYDLKKEEFDEIKSLTNPAVKKKLLDSLADDCDSSAVHLKAAQLPRQSSYVILPLTNIKENEIYAPKYRDGEEVVLIRHPHGGIFEIPVVKVNNKNSQAKSIIPQAKDAIGINPKVASQLSGADFDGDTVIVIPTSSSKNIKTSSAIKSLANFEPREAYPPYPGMKRISKQTKELKMGDVSNLITDMTIKGATINEITKAVKHSMVVIDAEKHNLNYQQSYKDHDIAALKEKYQGSARSGASTLISKASSEERVTMRKEITNQKKMTPEQLKDYKDGKRIYIDTPETYVNIQGKTVERKIKSTKMAETDDAFTLSSGTPIETVYATHANKLKALANESRKESLNTPKVEYSPSANKTYDQEVKSLDSKLNIALKNAPLERHAQLIANNVVDMAKKDNPSIKNDQEALKKLKQQALGAARARTGAGKELITITDKEWEAIQSGAVSHNKLTQIINNTDIDSLKQLATPRTKTGISATKINRARNMFDAGYTQAEIADSIGVSVNTIQKVLDN